VEVLCGCRGRGLGRGVAVPALRSTGRRVGGAWVRMRRGGGAWAEAEGRRRLNGGGGAEAPGRRRDDNAWMEKERRRRGTFFSLRRFARDAARGREGEASPGSSRWGGAGPGKSQGSGHPASTNGLPNSGEIWPGSSFRAGLLPGEKAGIPAGIRAPKLDLKGCIGMMDLAVDR
jgi:hypothetical protein